MLRHPGKAYAGALAATMAAALVLPGLLLVGSGAGPLAIIGGLLLALLPATVLGIAILHWLIARFTSPRLLPRMDFRKGIPADCATCVAVPVIIKDVAEISAIMERMEIRYLSNRDRMLRFVLLSDYADAPTEHLEQDAAIGAALVAAVRGLNARYADENGDAFFLLHRPRRYNPSEESWMGWERKRGKLEQFNGFPLLDGSTASFQFHEGEIANLSGFRFVITLDADTELPPGTASELIGTLAHPLNRAVVDPKTRKVVAGYAIVQPRIETLPLKGPVSLFCRLYAGDTAIDIYSRAVSNVYQDLFGTGIFVGKGIYDVAAFAHTLAGRIPENAVLSHDLFEGLYGRTGLASNIVLYEDHPANYIEHAFRLHRWMRGDWQLLPWLGRNVPDVDRRNVGNVLSGLDRWKIIDNFAPQPACAGAAPVLHRRLDTASGQCLGLDRTRDPGAGRLSRRRTADRHHGQRAAGLFQRPGVPSGRTLRSLVPDHCVPGERHSVVAGCHRTDALEADRKTTPSSGMALGRACAGR